MFSYINQAKIKTEKERTVWLGHMLLYFSPWESFLSGITHCMEQESFSLGQGHRIAQAAQVPRRRRGSIFNLQFQHQRWPLLETGGKMDHWACSGVIAPMFCSTERAVINKSAARGGHLPADEQWDCCAGLCSPGCFCCYWNVTLADSSVGSHIWRETGQTVEGFHIWGQLMPDEPLWKLLALHQPRGWPVTSTDSLWCRCHDSNSRNFPPNGGPRWVSACPALLPACFCCCYIFWGCLCLFKRSPVN